MDRLYKCDICNYQCKLILKIGGEVPKGCPFLMLLPDWKFEKNKDVEY